MYLLRHLIANKILNEYFTNYNLYDEHIVRMTSRVDKNRDYQVSVRWFTPEYDRVLEYFGRNKGFPVSFFLFTRGFLTVTVSRE